MQVAGVCVSERDVNVALHIGSVASGYIAGSHGVIYVRLKPGAARLPASFWVRGSWMNGGLAEVPDSRPTHIKVSANQHG